MGSATTAVVSSRTHAFRSGLFNAFAATLCWSSSALLIDRITSLYHLSPLQISVWRVAIVLPLLAVIVVTQVGARVKIRVADLPWYLAAGLGIAVSNVSWAASVQLNRPAAAAALGFSAPAFIALVERVLFRRHLLTIQVFAVVVNLVGCGLASGVGGWSDVGRSPQGLLAGLANGLAFTWYTLLNSHGRRSESINPNVTLFIVFAISEVGVVMWGLPTEGYAIFHPQLDVAGWVLMTCLGLGPTLGAYFFFNSSLRLLSAMIASLITTLEPPIVAVFALILLGRTVSIVQWTGIIAIVAAVACIQLSAARSQSSAESPRA